MSAPAFEMGVPLNAEARPLLDLHPAARAIGYYPVGLCFTNCLKQTPADFHEHTEAVTFQAECTPHAAASPVHPFNRETRHPAHQLQMDFYVYKLKLKDSVPSDIHEKGGEKDGLL